MHSFARIGARYHEHAHSLYIDTISSYGIIGTLLLAISTLKPVRMLLEMSRDPKKRPIVGLYVFIYRRTLRSRYLRRSHPWVQSAFLFLLVMTSIPMWMKQEENVMPHK